MKNIKSLLIFAAILFGLSMEVGATQYCETEINTSASGQSLTYYLTCQKIGNNYVLVAELKNDRTFAASSYSSNLYSGILGGWSDIHSYFSLSNSNKTLTATFPSQPNFSASGAAIIIVNGQYGGTNTFTPPTDITWGTCAPATKTLYFVNSWGWETPYVYLWQGSNESNKNAAWPGEPIKTTFTQISTTCTNAPVYAIEYNPDFDKVIFHNNSGSQTDDLNVLEGRFYNPHPEEEKADEWYYSNNLYLKGSFNSWNETNKFSSWSSGATTVTTTVTGLSANTNYTFKIWQKDANRYYGNNGTINAAVNCWFMDPDAGNCTLHTKAAGDYTFTYDFAANRLSVAYPAEVGCTGTSTSCTSGGSEFVRYTINYIGNKILFSVRSTTANALQTCKLNYATGTSGQNGVTNVGMTISDGEATYTLSADGVYASGTLYFYFTYKTAGMGSEGSTTSGWNSAFQYNIGGCALEDGIPYMMSVSKASATTSSVTLDVSGKVNVDGVAQETTQYRVSIDGGAYETYTATAGQITIDGLTHSTQYSFTVKAYYGGNESENSKTVTASTNRESNCGPVTWYQDNTSNYPIEFELKYDEGSGDLTIEATSQTAYKLDYFEALSSLWTGGKLATIDGSGKATVTIPAAQLAAVGTVGGIRFVYSMTDFGGNVQTAGNNDVQWAAVIYYVVGECGSSSAQEEPQMKSAETTSVGQETADIHLTSRDNKTSAANMKYHINVQSTSGYDTEWDLELTGQASGEYTLRGLVPNTSYTVTVYCEDGDGYRSTAAINTADHQQKTFSFTTANGDGCSWDWEGHESIVGPTWQSFPDGFNYRFRVKKYSDTQIQIDFELITPANYTYNGNTIFERSDGLGGWVELYMGSAGQTVHSVIYDASTRNYQNTTNLFNWNETNQVGVKCELNGGISTAGYFEFNPAAICAGTQCAGSFVITQKGRTPASYSLPEAEGGTITFDDQILYYRQFTPGQWEPFILPFAVSSVEVYDPDDNTMYNLIPKTSGGSGGKYLLRQQVTNVSGEAFKESWYDGTDNVPQKNTPYNIYFPSNGGWGPFFTKKFVLFRGTTGSQTVNANFSLGAAPGAVNQYTLYGNTTLSPTRLAKAYRETSDGTLYVLENNWDLQPFECYVLASAGTMRVMRRIAPWPNDVPTGIEDTWAETEILQKAAVFNAFGQLLFTEQNSLFYDIMQRCMNLPAGCYVIMSELGTKKIVVP